ncbi:kif3 [Symbiodinium natans]|uniref:Kinesin-like protein n=1 Tax=Symbiodinium natans TaxID=878477 RepID=A0A812TRA6_9DINO|nr:kif3 [Symbiodinium natans]
MATDGQDPHEESIKVCCRFRPQNQLEKEKEQSGRICVTVNGDGTSVYVPSIDNSFVFDRVFGVDATQKEVYDYAAKPIINGVLRGFNGTVFAYGQTASGKTHTMEGPDIEDEVQMGVIPRMVWSIFDGIDHAADYIEFLVKVSIVEIYNERIRDLLDPKKDNLKIHEDKARGVFIGEVTETYVGSEQEIFDIMKTGKYNRAVAATNLNEHSSRSHLIFMLTIEQTNLHDRSVKVGKLHLVDLAGSEKVAKTGASGERLDEAKNINRSLSALGNVINALTDRKSNHVPYRDSKLSRVLQESLGGNAKTSLIITCSPSYFNEQETVSTLRFGQRAKMIKNVVKVNHERSVEELKLLLERRDQAVSELRGRVSMLEQLLRSNGITVPEDKSSAVFLPAGAVPTPVDEAQNAELEEQLQELRGKLKTTSEQLCEANREKEEVQSQLRVAEDEKHRLTMQAMDAQNDRESIEYERNEQVSELEKLRNEKVRLAQELEELTKSHQNLIQSAASAPTGKGPGCRASSAEDNDAERPLLKWKVSRLDQNLEQLTVMYHKLVAQNSGLKVESAESDKKIERKDQRIQQLERNLREAKQKYEKLLTQCANLTAMIDVRGRKNCTCGASGNSSQVRRAIKQPLRGGVASTRSENSSGLGTAEPLGTPQAVSPSPPSEQASTPTSSPVSLRGGIKSREGVRSSKTLLDRAS